ncbi:MAG: cardiolipin synthase [Lachnospiraceae bacterium]
MNKIIKFLFSRFFIIGAFILVQFLWILLLFYNVSLKFSMANIFFRILGILVSLYIINNWTNPYYKLSWIFVLLMVPLLGLVLYIVFGRSNISKRTRKRMEKIHTTIVDKMQTDDSMLDKLRRLDLDAAAQSKYILDWAKYPLFHNSKTKYFRCGEEMYLDMLGALERAENFIFLEYFIVEDGQMLQSILEILRRKAALGIKVRFIYDDVGSIKTIPKNFKKNLESMGIECAAFNPFLPVLSIVYNNRDHRKILVVDGQIAFTGGINLADEYINIKNRFGYWKDTGVVVRGEAVWSLTSMFLEIWNSINRCTEDYEQYLPKEYNYKEKIEDGFVQPYGDSPLDHENVGENIYLNMLHRAKEYVYIFTPYLIIDNEMTIALCNAAKCGVDVRIITPGIPDKKMIFMMTQSYYEQLIESGVRIFEFTPGFLHAKCFVSDDKLATVGTVNLDYRSLYLHFENGVFMYRSQAVLQVKSDFLATQEVSKEITLEFCRSRPIIIRMMRGMIKLAAPLM